MDPVYVTNKTQKVAYATGSFRRNLVKCRVSVGTVQTVRVSVGTHRARPPWLGVSVGTWLCRASVGTAHMVGVSVGTHRTWPAGNCSVGVSVGTHKKAAILAEDNHPTM